MKYKPGLMIIIGVFIIVMVSAGIYLNKQLSHLSQSGISLLDQDKGGSDCATELLETPEDISQSVQDNGNSAAKAGSSKVSQNSPQAYTGQTSNENLVTHVQKKIGQPIEKKDVLIAGLILMRKLSTEDISYLSKVAMKDSYSQEDYRKSQEILLQKLSADDIAALKKLGRKYGSEVKILNQNADF